jgi:hypothetical protein
MLGQQYVGCNIGDREFLKSLYLFLMLILKQYLVNNHLSKIQQKYEK